MVDAQEPTLPDAQAHDHAPDDETIARAEAKPPLYRVFRGAMYVTYMTVVVWLCLSIIVGVYRSFMTP